MKLTKRWIAILASVGTILLSAIAINWKSSLREVASECLWKFSTVLTFILGGMSKGAEDGMRYLNENSMGVSALCAIIGLGFSIYFQWKGSNKKDEE